MTRGRVRSIFVRWLVFNLLALCAVFALAYAAGSRSGGLSLLDFGALPLNSGLRLVGAAFILLLAAASLVWVMARILHPLEQLTSFSAALTDTDALSSTLDPDHAVTLPPASNDDFGFIADQLGRSREHQLAAAADQR